MSERTRTPANYKIVELGPRLPTVAVKPRGGPTRLTILSGNLQKMMDDGELDTWYQIAEYTTPQTARKAIAELNAALDVSGPLYELTSGLLFTIELVRLDKKRNCVCVRVSDTNIGSADDDMIDPDAA